MNEQNFSVKPATLDHLELLLDLEQQCFTTDRLSRRGMRRFLLNEQSVFMVALHQDRCVGYLLIIFHRGTRPARLYSIAVNPEWRGQGVAWQMMGVGEQEAQHCGALYFRLEVNNTNINAIKLYESLGLKIRVLQDYYDDHSDALRMQKAYSLSGSRFRTHYYPLVPSKHAVFLRPRCINDGDGWL